MPNKFIPPTTTTATRTGAIPLQGELVYDINEDRFYYGDGVTIGGKTFQGTVSAASGLTLTETSEPSTPGANSLILYVDSGDGTLKQKDDTGTVTVVGGSGSSPGSNVSLTDIWLHGGF